MNYLYITNLVFRPGKHPAMKTFLITICLLLLFTTSPAQSWSPVNRNEKFNYAKASMSYITHTVWVDSAFLSGADSLFWLNRIVTSCDTCLGQQYRLCNQAGILKKRMKKMPGGVYEFRYPGSVVIRTLASTGQSWLYDTASNITATVFSKSWSQVFGIWDSVKQIHLSDGGSLVISKNHGLLQFTTNPAQQVYDLRGIEGRNLGDLVPKFAQVYNFNVGDVFQYHFRDMNYGIGYGTEGLNKITILSRDSSAGHYLYGIRSLTCSWTTNIIGIHSDTTHSYEITTMELQDSLDIRPTITPSSSRNLLLRWICSDRTALMNSHSKTPADYSPKWWEAGISAMILLFSGTGPGSIPLFPTT